ncbi:MAG: AbrB/MazE/SpoVT family DNA-binding domain-containing protein [Methylococcaceae bacterium]|nr:AbrB/MazE/SpoVT family DNA-binding domain-containing protein [Methylococcaceae bacterium]
MAHLIKSDNSQSIRIPQAIIKQANLQDKAFEIHVVANGILITPIISTREGWEEQFKNISASDANQDFNETHSNLEHGTELAMGETWEW